MTIEIPEKQQSDTKRNTSSNRMLYITNSLSGKKELFQPIDPTNVSMYVCGITTYDYCHIGHARVMIVFDMINNYLRHIYGDNNVTYVRNITDVDDKIIQRAIANNESISELTSRFIKAMHTDEDSLGVRRPDIEPKATDHIDNIQSMIQTLIDREMAYVAENGDVYYNTESFKSYGKLSGRNLSELQPGKRIDVNDFKKSPFDFALWKNVSNDEPSWDSNWGPGRPGWHIECSAMAYHCLSEKIDIHGGGLDLKFPHHENEIAQSEGCFGDKHVNYWIHNGYVRIDNEKMSKSKGNFFLIKDVLKNYDSETLRFFILSSHYMSPLNYSTENLEIAKKSIRTLYQSISGIKLPDNVNSNTVDISTEYTEAFLASLDDDFNTPVAISILFKISHKINSLKNTDFEKAKSLACELKYLSGFLGVLREDASSYLHHDVDSNGIQESEIIQLIEKRNQAKKKKNWGESDRIRDYLHENNVALDDMPDGTRWRRC